MDVPQQQDFKYCGEMEGHRGWVTAIAASDASGSEVLISASRDKTLILWEITRTEGKYGFAKKCLTGHNHYVQDVVLSSDGQFALSASWDTTMRLWDLNQGKTHRRFLGHSKDVLSVAFSGDNRQIVSGSRDKTIGLWNTIGECKFVIKDEGHSDWVSCVKFSPSASVPLIVSAGWDKVVKVWNLTKCTLLHTLTGHTGPINTVTVSPDGSLCASAGADGTAMLWDLNEGKHLYSLDGTDTIHSLVFSPNRYWLCAASEASIKIWDLESKLSIAELAPDFPPVSRKAQKPHAISLAWSSDGNTLFAGYTDSNIRVWEVSN